MDLQIKNMAKKKLAKQERREQRLQKAKQWVTTYKGTPKKMVKHYKEKFHVDTACAVNDLKAVGVEFTQEYLDVVRKSEEERIRQKHLIKQEKFMQEQEWLYEECDDNFACIAGYTDGGAPYGTQWWEIGIDPSLPFEEKVRRYRSGEFREMD